MIEIKKNIVKIAILFFVSIFTSCTDSNSVPARKSVETADPVVEINATKTIGYIALGDSYTIGESVCSSCRFPEQLKKKIQDLQTKENCNVKVIATTGWTTTNLKDAIVAENLTLNYDLATLLIGVNNQYQNKPFSVYEQEFPELVKKAITLVKGDKSNLIVISIPDYSFTPFGERSGNSSKVSYEIDIYNAYAEKYCLENNIEFVNITDITRQGLLNPLLVATDGLHPSELAYSNFVDRILPKALNAIRD